MSPQPYRGSSSSNESQERNYWWRHTSVKLLWKILMQRHFCMGDPKNMCPRCVLLVAGEPFSGAAAPIFHSKFDTLSASGVPPLRLLPSLIILCWKKRNDLAVLHQLEKAICLNFFGSKYVMENTSDNWVSGRSVQHRQLNISAGNWKEWGLCCSPANHVRCGCTAVSGLSKPDLQSYYVWYRMQKWHVD